MNDCIFCKIVRGKQPAFYVYEDDKVIGILDHRPVHPGHSMIIPKNHTDYFINLPDDLAAHIVAVGNKLGRKMLETLSPEPIRIGFVVHGSVPHVHYHVIPQYTEHDITTATCAKIEDDKIVFDSEFLPLADLKSQNTIAQRIKI